MTYKAYPREPAEPELGIVLFLMRIGQRARKFGVARRAWQTSLITIVRRLRVLGL